MERTSLRSVLSVPFAPSATAGATPATNCSPADVSDTLRVVRWNGLYAELRLEGGDGMTRGRTRHVEIDRRVAEVAVTRHHNKTLSLSKASAGTGVTADGIMPGPIHAPQLDGWFQAMAERHVGSTDPRDGEAFVPRNVVHQIVNRLRRPADVATAAVYLASPSATS